jgi:hypothetical protein
MDFSHHTGFLSSDLLAKVLVYDTTQVLFFSLWLCRNRSMRALMKDEKCG